MGYANVVAILHHVLTTQQCVALPSGLFDRNLGTGKVYWKKNQLIF
jgi:hypothetical protein